MTRIIDTDEVRMLAGPAQMGLTILDSDPFQEYEITTHPVRFATGDAWDRIEGSFALTFTDCPAEIHDLSDRVWPSAENE